MLQKKHLLVIVFAAYLLLIASVVVLSIRRFREDETTQSSYEPAGAESLEMIENETSVPEPSDDIEEADEIPQETAIVPDNSAYDENIMSTNQVFTFDGAEVLWLSITEEQLKEYAGFLRKELNLNDAAIAGVLANIQAESKFNPQKIGDMGDAYGICQWHGARLDQMVAFCEDQGYNPISIEGQLHFLVYDLVHNYIYPYDLLLACPDSEQGAVRAAFYFCAYYESPVNVEEISPERERLTKVLIYPKLNEFSMR